MFWQKTYMGLVCSKKVKKKIFWFSYQNIVQNALVQQYVVLSNIRIIFKVRTHRKTFLLFHYLKDLWSKYYTSTMLVFDGKNIDVQIYDNVITYFVVNKIKYVCAVLVVTILIIREIYRHQERERV